MLYAFAISGSEAEIVRTIYPAEGGPAFMRGRLLELNKARANEFVRDLWAYAELKGIRNGDPENNLLLRLQDRAAKIAGYAALQPVQVPATPVDIPIVNEPETVQGEVIQEVAEIAEA